MPKDRIGSCALLFRESPTWHKFSQEAGSLKAIFRRELALQCALSSGLSGLVTFVNGARLVTTIPSPTRARLMQENDAVFYRTWGHDNVAYGPIELPAMVTWIRQGRVTPKTWIYREDNNQW